MYYGTEAQQVEKSILLADRRTNSLDEEQLLGTLDEHSNASPSTSSVASEKASHGLLVELQGSRLANRLKGLGLAGISTLFQAAMSVCARDLGQSGVPVFEIALVRGLMVLSISYAKASSSTQHTCPHALGKRQWLLVLRGSLGFGVVSSLYWSLQYLPLSDALVFTFLSPLMVAALSPVFNKELPTLLVVVAMIISLAGMVMIAQPSFIFGGQGINKLGLALGIMQAGFNACARLSVRELRKTETTDIIMLYSGTMQSVLAVAACVIVPHSFAVPQHTWQAVTLVLTGCFAYGGGVALTAALRLVEASSATAMSYLTVVWGLILGFFFFSEVPGLWSLLGAAVVCSTTMLLGWDEKRRHSKQKQPQPQQVDNGPDAEALDEIKVCEAELQESNDAR